jgi:hypothetical protein
MRDHNLPIPEMCAAEGVFEAILYRYVDLDRQPTVYLRGLTRIRTLTVLRRLESESG